jgi:hypothetical protein
MGMEILGVADSTLISLFGLVDGPMQQYNEISWSRTSSSCNIASMDD